MYRNRARTFLGASSIVSLVVAVFLFAGQALRSSVAASCNPETDYCTDPSSFGIAGIGVIFLVLGMAMGIGYLVARSVSYDAWYRSTRQLAPPEDDNEDERSRG
jgi:hypothetical protein